MGRERTTSFLLRLGHALERYAKGRTRRAIEALAELAPEFVFVRRESDIVEVSIGQLEPARHRDRHTERPHSCRRIVIKGESSINQARSLARVLTALE